MYLLYYIFIFNLSLRFRNYNWHKIVNKFINLNWIKLYGVKLIVYIIVLQKHVMYLILNGYIPNSKVGINKVIKLINSILEISVNGLNEENKHHKKFYYIKILYSKHLKQFLYLQG